MFENDFNKQVVLKCISIVLDITQVLQITRTSSKKLPRNIEINLCPLLPFIIIICNSNTLRTKTLKANIIEM